MGAKNKKAAEHNAQGWSSRVKHDLDKAKADFLLALKLEPEMALAQYGLAQTLMEQGDKKAAIKHFKNAATLLEKQASDDDPIRNAMLHRQALGYFEHLSKGKWDLLSIGNAIPKE